MKRILMLKAGEAALATREIAGDYDRWFLQVASRPGVAFDIVRPFLGEKLPDPAPYDAVLMTGSPLSVTEPAPWMYRSAELMRTAADKNLPVLGVCFGHQLLGLAYGGKVVKNPRGREIGTVEITLTDEARDDSLFHGVPTRFAAQTTHEDIVPTLPEGARLLATNGFCGIQAMAIGKHVRGVQFHPEMPTEGMRAVIVARAAKLDLEGRQQGLQPGERAATLLGGVRPTPHAMRVLQNFVAQLL